MQKTIVLYVFNITYFGIFYLPQNCVHMCILQHQTATSNTSNILWYVTCWGGWGGVSGGRGGGGCNNVLTGCTPRMTFCIWRFGRYAVETSCILEDASDDTRLRLHVSWKMVSMIRGWDWCIWEDGFDDTRLRLHVSWKMLRMIRGWDFKYLGRWFRWCNDDVMMMMMMMMMLGLRVCLHVPRGW